MTSRRASILAFHERPTLKYKQSAPQTTLDCSLEILERLCASSGISPSDVDGLLITGIMEATMFGVATAADYLGLSLSYGDNVDLGGASAVGMVQRARNAVESGMCRAVACLLPAVLPIDLELLKHGATGFRAGSHQQQFELPFGLSGQNMPYGILAELYDQAFGWDREAVAQVIANLHLRGRAAPNYVFGNRVVDRDTVVQARRIAGPMSLYEAVMPVTGGAGFLVASDELDVAAPDGRIRPVGYGERIRYKAPFYQPDVFAIPIGDAARASLASAGLGLADIDLFSFYDCYSVTLMLSAEAIGLAPRGTSIERLQEWTSDPNGKVRVNVDGGQLCTGQPQLAGGAITLIQALRQLRGEGGPNQLRGIETALVTGIGGIASESTAVVLRRGDR